MAYLGYGLAQAEGFICHHRRDRRLQVDARPRTCWRRSTARG
jgi:hypothetical protein